MRVRKTQLDLAVYSSSIYIYYSDSLIKAVDQIRKKYPEIEKQEKEDANALSFSDYSSYPGEYWIIITPHCSIREMVHEAVHTANRLLYEHSVVFHVDNDEPYTYLISYLTDIIVDFVTKCRKKK
jgi:hypothetical protein